MKKYIPFTIEVIFIAFIMPLLISQLRFLSSIVDIATLLVNIFFIMIFSILFGRSHRFSGLLPLISGIIFLFYAYINSFPPAKIVVYVGLYMVTTLVGNLTGLIFGKKEK